MPRVLIASDNFNRADNPIGANWTYLRDTDFQVSPPLIRSNLLRATNSGLRFPTCRWDGAGVFTDNQYATALVGGLTFQQNSDSMGVTVRTGAGLNAAATFYGFEVLFNGPGVYTTRLFKFSAGVATLIAAAAQVSWVNGDVIELEATGTTITGFRNGVVVLTATDTDITTGKPGLMIGGDITVAALDDWTGGNISSDVTAPVMTGTVVVSAISASGLTSTITAATDAVGVTGYQLSVTSSATPAYVDVGNVLTFASTGLTASTLYNINWRAYDAAGNFATPIATTATTSAGGADTTAPTMNGAITIGTVTSTSIQTSWPAATDAVGVTGYKHSKDNGATYLDIGNILTYTCTGLTPSTAYIFKIYAYDAAGNPTTNGAAVPLTVTQSTSAASGGTLTLPPLKISSGSLRTSEAGLTVDVYSNTTGLHITRLTGQSSHATTAAVVLAGVAGTVAATRYRLIIATSAGELILQSVVAT